LLNVVGHTLLGFEQSWAQPIVSVLAAYVVEIVLELVDSSLKQRSPRFLGGPVAFVDFLLSAHITGLAVAMLLYANQRLTPVVFASAAAIGSKAIFRAPFGERVMHFFNPSNFGISLTLLLFPWVGIAPPYHFTENVTGVWDWIIPGFILLTGVIIHGCFTGRLPLVAAWLIGFALQGQIRAQIFGVPPIVPLTPMTSAAFIVFTLYMIPDPATTPLKPWRQAAFGFAVALLPSFVNVAGIGGRYFLLDGYHRAYGLLAAGVTRVPALVKNYGQLQECRISPGMLSPDVFLGDHAPLLPDYLDDTVCADTMAPVVTKMIVIQALEVTPLG